MINQTTDPPDTGSEIVGVLRLRYFLTERVYYHHTEVVAGAMISKVVELAPGHRLLGEDELLRRNGWTSLERLDRWASKLPPSSRSTACGPAFFVKKTPWSAVANR